MFQEFPIENSEICCCYYQMNELKNRKNNVFIELTSIKLVLGTSIKGCEEKLKNKIQDLFHFQSFSWCLLWITNHNVNVSWFFRVGICYCFEENCENLKTVILIQTCFDIWSIAQMLTMFNKFPIFSEEWYLRFRTALCKNWVSEVTKLDRPPSYRRHKPTSAWFFSHEATTDQCRRKVRKYGGDT